MEKAVEGIEPKFNSLGFAAAVSNASLEDVFAMLGAPVLVLNVREEDYGVACQLAERWGIGMSVVTNEECIDHRGWFLELRMNGKVIRRVDVASAG